MVKIINLKQEYGKSKDKALPPKERDELHKQLKDTKDKILFILGAYGGLRVGEIAQCRFNWLEWKEFNDEKVLAINIPNEDKDSKNLYKLWRPKTKKGRTTYIFKNDCANELYFYFKHNERGLQLTERALRYRVSRSWGLKNFSPHALRAMAQNYFLYELNFEPKVIAVMLGHSDIRTTMKFYNTMNKASVESYLVNRGN